MAQTHELPARPDTVVWGSIDASTPPVLEVDSGDTVVLHAVPAGGEASLPPDRSLVTPAYREILDKVAQGPGAHILTGPTYVRGAEIGDVLQVDILDVTVNQDWGFVAIMPLLGTLPDEFTEYETIHPLIDHERGVTKLPWGTDLPLDPFFGVISVAPPKAWGRCISNVPRTFGGNMDNKELRKGTTLYLPVLTEGALFLAGDGHGVQGDGEVCITALETGLTGTFRLTVRKDLVLQDAVRRERHPPDLDRHRRGPRRRGEAGGARDGARDRPADEPVAQPGLHALLARRRPARHPDGRRQQGLPHDAAQDRPLRRCRRPRDGGRRLC